MKSDLDRLMHEFNLDLFIVMGDRAPNSYRDYLTSGTDFGGLVIKWRGEEPFIVTSGMEIEEAAKSGLKVYQCFDFQTDDLYDLAAYFNKDQISGRVALFGVADVAETLRRVADLQRRVPGMEIVTDPKVAAMFNKAYETKDDKEIANLKEAARLTSQLVRDVWDFISQHRAEGNIVVDAEGKPLTIGQVKQFIHARELELGLDDPDGCIFSQGRDAALPHSRGEESQPLEIGKSIVFDIFPRVAATGYYHDMTRTWCIGQAPAEVQDAYDQVMEVFHSSEDTYRVGTNSQQYQLMALDYFEKKGHKTLRSNPGGLDGYVHGLGHGLGLNVHEMPHFGHRREGTPLAPGMAFTLEPGLYYPDRGFGVRVEDTLYIDAQGAIHTLTDFHYDLVLPLKGQKK